MSGKSQVPMLQVSTYIGTIILRCLKANQEKMINFLCALLECLVNDIEMILIYTLTLLKVYNIIIYHC